MTNPWYALPAILLVAPLSLQSVSFGSMYVAGTNTYSLELTDGAIVMKFDEGKPLRMELPLAATLRPAHSETDSARLAKVRYDSPFPGIDLDVYWRDGKVEYDWIVAPCADPSLIRVSFTGAERLRLDVSGDLLIETATGYVLHTRPRIYQDIGGVRHEVAGGFRLDANGSVSFWIADYDRSRRLVIDPQLVWAARFGSYIRRDEGTLHTVVSDFASGIAVDQAGNTYVTGTAVSSDFPLVQPLQDTCSSNHCVFVTKFAPDGKAAVYSTYLGTPATIFGFPSYDGKAPIPAAIVSDPDGNLYVAGAASQMPRSGGGTLRSAGGDDAFVVKLDPKGALVASMLIGGSADDQATSISLGPDGYLYVAGTTQSNDFPVSPNAYRTIVSGPVRFFSLKIDPKAFVGNPPFPQPMVYSTVFGTYSQSYSNPGRPQVGADAQGDAYVSVYTDCTGMAATPGAVASKCSPTPYANFGTLVKINPSGAKLLWIAMPPGPATSIAVDPDGFAYIAGAASLADFPLTPGAVNFIPGPANDSGPFIAKLTPDGSKFVYATWLGDAASSNGIGGIALDARGNVYVAGGTRSAQFPTLNSIQSSLGNCCAGFVTVLKPDGSGLVWSTLLGVDGSVGVFTPDAAGNIYAAGYGINSSGGASAFGFGSTIDVVKISPDGVPFPIDAITNAASYQPGLPMSGGLANMFVHGLDLAGTVTASGVPLPVELAGLSILVQGIPAPILSVSDLGATGTPGSQQINFQVPFEALVQRYASPFGVSTQRHTSVELRYQGLSSFGMPVTSPPGIFTLPDCSGAIQHGSDYAPVTPDNPAVPGETIIVYATGLGPVRPAVETGSAATAPASINGFCYTPPTVNVGSVLYAGLAPGIPGMYQLNVRLPANAPSGTQQMYITWTDCQHIASQMAPVIYVASKSNSVPLPVR